MNRIKPAIIQKVGFDFSWDESKVWKLTVAEEYIPIEDLIWHLEVPFLWSKPDGYYDLKPRKVLENPEKYPDEYTRMLNADLKYPIDIMFWRGRWVILDGLHRLMKQVSQKVSTVRVRKIPRDAIENIKT